MIDVQVNVERLPERLREPARVYAQAVLQIAGSQAAALSFYGLVVDGAIDLSTQPARSVLVLESVRLETLRALGEHGRRFGKAGIAAPVVMTPDYIARSLDTFALELLEIRQQHTLLFGKDLFSSLNFDERHVRMQCERELKAAMLAMHDGLVGSGGADRLLHQVVAEVAEGLVRILRGIVWLKGARDTHPTPALLSRVEETTGRKLPGIRSALDATQRHDWNAFALLYGDVADLGKLVDAW